MRVCRREGGGDGCARSASNVSTRTTRDTVFCAALSDRSGNSDWSGNEGYFGGRRSAGKLGRGAPGKTIVTGLISRKHPMKAVVNPNVKKDMLRSVVLDNV